jgi:hypothetical protein
MQFEAGKLFWMFIGFIAVGALIIAMSKETPQDKLQSAYLQTYSQLHKIGTDKCVEAVLEASKTRPYSPSQTAGDHQTWVSFVWTNVGTVKQAECRYETDKGITLLKLDDRTLIPQTP